MIISGRQGHGRQQNQQRRFPGRYGPAGDVEARVEPLAERQCPGIGVVLEIRCSD